MFSSDHNIESGMVGSGLRSSRVLENENMEI